MSVWGSLLEGVAHFHFLRPEWFAVVPLMFFLLWRLRARELKTDWQHFIDEDLLNAMLLRQQSSAWLTPRRLAAIMFLLSVFILAGPSWQRQLTPLTDDKAPLVIALSLHEQMLEDDLVPSRLQHAKLKIRDVLSRRSGAPTALLVYAGSAHTVLPLTEDSELLAFYLEDLKSDIMPLSGNHPELALAQAAHLLRDYQQAGSLLFVAADLGASTQWLENPPDNLSLNWLRVAALDSLNSEGAVEQAKAMGATLVNISADEQDTETLLREIKHNWQQQQAAGESVVWIDGGYYFLWLLLLLMLLWFRRGMVLQW